MRWPGSMDGHAFTRACGAGRCRRHPASRAGGMLAVLPSPVVILGVIVALVIVVLVVLGGG